MQIYLRAAIFWKRWEKTLSSLVWGKVKNAAGESLNNKKLICHSQRRCDFANDVKSSKYNQLETVLGCNIFIGTPVSTTTAALREKCPYSEFFWSVFSHIQTRKTSITGTFHVVLLNAIVFAEYLTDEGQEPLLPARATVRHSHHRKSLTCRKQGFNLHRSWVQALLNESVQ